MEQIKTKTTDFITKQRLFFVAFICVILLDIFGCIHMLMIFTSLKLMLVKVDDDNYPSAEDSSDYDSSYEDDTDYFYEYLYGLDLYGSYRVFGAILLMFSQLGLLYGVIRVSLNTVEIRNQGLVTV